MTNDEITYNTSFKYLGGKKKSHILNSAVLIKIERVTDVVEKLSVLPLFTLLCYISLLHCHLGQLTAYPNHETFSAYSL